MKSTGTGQFSTEMVMENSRSTADEQRVAPSRKLNGSDIIDLTLSEFGKRAEQMPLNIASNHQNLHGAGVSVQFQEIIDLDSEEDIETVAVWDNSSKYDTNHPALNFTEVTKLLPGKCDDNRFLILQGEVEQISLMKPKPQGPHDEGFLESTKLASERTAFEMAELQATVSNLEEDLKTKREKHREESNNFKTHIKKMIKLIDDNLEKDVAKISKLTKQFEDTMDMIHQLEEDFPKLQNRLENAEKVLDEIKENFKVETEVFRNELADVRTELEEPWEEKLIDYGGKYQVALTEKNLLNEQHEAGRADYECAQRQIHELRGRIETSTSSVNDIRIELEKHTLEASAARKLEKKCLEHQESLIRLEKAARQKMSELLESGKNQGGSKPRGGNMGTSIHAANVSSGEAVSNVQKELSALVESLDIIRNKMVDAVKRYQVSEKAASHLEMDLLKAQKEMDSLNLVLGDALKATSKPNKDVVDRLKEKHEAGRADYECAQRQIHELRGRIETSTSSVNDIRIELEKHTLEASAARKLEKKCLEHQESLIRLEKAARQKMSELLESGKNQGGSKPRGGNMGTSIHAANVSSGEAVSNVQKELSALVESLDIIRNKMVDAVKHYQVSEKAASYLEMDLLKAQKEIDSLNLVLGDALKATSKPNKDVVDRLKELGNIISFDKKETYMLMHGSKQLKEKALELQKMIKLLTEEIEDLRNEREQLIEEFQKVERDDKRQYDEWTKRSLQNTFPNPGFGDIDRSTRIPESGKMRRLRRPWSALEENTLKLGVERWGHRWKTILSENEEVFEGRTNIDLKDKFRNLVNSGKI